MPEMVDLCCGFGGASRAMRERGWGVTSYDCLSTVKPDILIDVRKLIALPRDIDLVWASPPCQQFSVHGPLYKNCVAARREPDMSIVLACKRLIDECKPRWWIIENMLPSRKWIGPILGPVFTVIDGHCLWGRIPGLLPQIKRGPGRAKERRGGGAMRPLLRAVIPFEISEALAIAVERRLADERAA